MLDPSASTPAQPGTPGSLQPERFTPGPSGITSFDTYLGPLTFLGDLIERYGDVVRYQTRFGPCFLFVHPEHVKTILHRENYRRASLVQMMLGDGLLASDGPFWQSQRRLMQQEFLPARIAPFVSMMTMETAKMATAWQIAAQNAAAIDVTASMTRLTLRIIIRALFSSDLSDDQANELCAAITQTITDMGKISWTIFGVPVQFSPDSSANFSAGKTIIDATCYHMIARRRALASAARPRDLLTLLIEAATENGPLNDRQIRDEVVTMLVGGHETTALALAWTWQAIAEHREIETKLHQEVDGVMGRRTPDLADLSKLPWTRAVFQEAMRLYPPVWYMARVANQDDVLHGHLIPRGACVLVSAWFTHRHKDFWPAPEQFDPARFINPALEPAHRYAYFPFGGGRHQCLGMHFALMEGAMILAQLAQQFRLTPVDGQQIQPAPGITLRQSPSMRAFVELRGTSPVALEAV